jgi:hypothetical protein
MISQEILIEVYYNTPGDGSTISVEISFITTPYMRKMWTGEYQFTRTKGFDAVSYKTGACALQNHKKLVLGMGMPDGVKVLVFQIFDYENLGWRNGGFMQSSLESLLSCRSNAKLVRFDDKKQSVLDKIPIGVGFAMFDIRIVI